MKTEWMKRALAILLTVVMLLGMAACASNNQGDSTSEPASETLANSATDNSVEEPVFSVAEDDETIYMNAYGEFYEAYQAAMEAETVAERHALLAVAEAKALEASGGAPMYGPIAGYIMTRMVHASGVYAPWRGTMTSIGQYILTNEIITAEDQAYIKTLWTKLMGTGTYIKEVKSYQALVLLEESGARYHYLAPVYELYFSLFQCQYDQETAAYDPFANEELRSFCSETTLYTNDADQIRLELLGNNTVRLRISEDYLRFADENGISCFVDLFWMKNAFIADYIAGILVENGYTHGSLISRDGFIRHLGDMPGTEFAFTLSHRDGVTVSDAETLRFSSAASLVYLRDYPLGDADAGNYYVFEDGTVRFPYIDPADGYCKSAIPELAAVSTEMGCAELVLKLAPLYIADALDQAGLQALAREGIAVYDYS